MELNGMLGPVRQGARPGHDRSVCGATDTPDRARLEHPGLRPAAGATHSGRLLSCAVALLGAGCGGSGGTGGGGDDTSSAPDLGLSFETPLPLEAHLSELTDPQLTRLCEDYAAMVSQVDEDMHAYLCLAEGVDAQGVSSDPVDTCEKLSGPCKIVPPGTMEDGQCRLEVWSRFREECKDPTVAEFIACSKDNLGLMSANVALGKLTCAEAIPKGTLRPTTLRDCACGTPDRIGPAPADDTDWDYVKNADDLCPETEHGYVVSTVGCSQYEDYDGDFVPNAADLCGASPDGAVVNAVGCTTDEDTDQDNVPDTGDLCLETAPGAAPLQWGCSRAQDEDFDGVPNAVDWCPFTPEVHEGLAYGCAEGQGSPWKESTVTTLPEGLTAVTLGAGADATTLHLLPTGLTTDNGVTHYSGTVLLEVPGQGYQQWTNGELELGGPDATVPETFGGELPIPIPLLGAFEALKFDNPANCRVGFGPGSGETVSALAPAVVPERHYLYGACDFDMGALLGPLRFAFQGKPDRLFTVAIDVMDPGVAFAVDIRGLRPFGPLEDVVVGISTTGKHHFEPENTWGAEEDLTPFDGHILLSGTLPIELNGLPQMLELEAEGVGVLDADADKNGFSLAAPLPDLRLGANGRLITRLRFLKGEDIGLTIGKGTLGLVVTPSTQAVTLSGKVGPLELQLPQTIPLEPLGELDVVAHIGSDWTSSRIVADGHFSFKGSGFKLPLIPDLLDTDVTAHVEITTGGIHATGTIDSAIHPWIDVDGKLEFEAQFSWDFSHFHVELSGNMSVALPGGPELALDVYLGSDDIRINGESLPFL